MMLTALSHRPHGSGGQPAIEDPAYRWPTVAPAIPGDTTPYEMPAVAPWNAPSALTVPTYEASGDAIHPSVVDFYDDPWQGWRFWMAFTPYPDPYGEPYENPSIVVSSDGYTWQVPVGLTNPIHPWSGISGAYNSDTELVYDPTGDRLICYWREVFAADESDTRTMAATSTDGHAWSAPVTVIPAAGHRDTLSPAVVRRAAGDWWMFGVKRPDGSSGYTGVSVYRSTDPLSGWSAATFVPVSPALPWHGDVLWDGTAWRMLLSDSPTVRSYWALSSSDGYEWTTAVKVMESSAGWDSVLYRPTMTVMDAARFRVWYSSVDDPLRRTGYTRMPRSLWPAP